MQNKNNKRVFFLQEETVKQFFAFFQLFVRGKKIALLSCLILIFAFFALFFAMPSAKEGADLKKEGEEQEPRLHGFALFDGPTWIKGEKEIQILEMRALKEELEKDLATFEPIAKASVIIDVPPQNGFREVTHKAKASIIVTLHEGAMLTPSQLHAMAYHVSGAVRGLAPEMIAISDTKGKLYQAIHQGGVEYTSQINKEEELIEKISSFLNKIIGLHHYHVQMMQHEGKKELALMIDAGIMQEKERPALERQLKSMFSDGLITIDFVFFADRALPHEKKMYSVWPFMIVAFALLSLTSVFFLKQRKGGTTEKQEAMDMGKLAELIKEQDPKVIALMFSYLESEKAEKLLFALPYGVQKKVALHLSSEKI